MGNGITDFLEANVELAKGISVTLASETLSKLSGEALTTGGKVLKFGSIIVEPAVWLATSKVPNLVDLLYLGTSAVATYTGHKLLTRASLGAGLAKTVIENQTNKKLQEAMRSEADPTRASEIKLCSEQFSFSSGEMIDALKLTRMGAVTWQHPNGLWVCLRDKAGHLVCDYEPKVFSKVYAPVLPLEPVTGGFDFFTY